MSNDTTVKSEASVVLDIKALAQRIRDLDIFPGMTFAGEFSVISNDMRSVTSDLASHNRQWAHQLESIAEDMAECGCAGDHWDRGDSRDAVNQRLGRTATPHVNQEHTSKRQRNS